MKRLLNALAVLLAVVLTASAAEQKAPQNIENLSLRNEVDNAIDRGLAYLKQQQQADGHWSNPDHTAVTALVLLAMRGRPGTSPTDAIPASLEKSYQFITNAAKPDGGIYLTNLPNYNTAISMLALLAANRAEYRPLILNARSYLVGNQMDSKEATDEPFNGGVGYGSHYHHSDMANTLSALEALYYSRQFVADQPKTDKDLNWAGVIQFIQNCQNLPGYNKLTWVADSPKDKGGFIYYPGKTNAGTETNSVTGRVALRAYGSISYAGMLSYIYASVKPNDPRVLAVFDWLRSNYTLDENPGMGTAGLFFYYHTMTKALNAAGVEELSLPDGRKVAWRKELSLRLFNLQKPDGSWLNDNGRWWEKDPVLVTAYAVLTLEMIERGL